MVITGREKVMGGNSLMPQKANCKEPDSLGNHQLWQLCGVKNPKGSQLHKCSYALASGWLTVGRMFSFSTLLTEKWQWMEGMVQSLSCWVVHITLTGLLHLLLWWFLLALVTLEVSERQEASPCKARWLPRRGGMLFYSYCTEIR